MEVLLFNLSLNLRLPRPGTIDPKPQDPSFPPAWLHTWLISARLLFCKAHYLFDFSVIQCARGIHGHECRTETTFCYTLDAVSYW